MIYHNNPLFCDSFKFHESYILQLHQYILTNIPSVPSNIYSVLILC